MSLDEDAPIKRKAQGCFKAGEPRPWSYKGGAKAARERYRRNNAEKIKERKRIAYQNNKEASRKKSEKWRKDNPELWREMMRKSNKKQRDQLRSKMLIEYGSQCKCCGESEPYFLDLDHVNNNGADDRKINGSGVKLLLRLEKLGWPKSEYQLLCCNCNQGKQRNGGICPHTQKKSQ